MTKRLTVVILLVYSTGLLAQSKLDGVNVVGPMLLHRGTLALRPATCTVGQTFFVTDATAGQNLHGCTTANTWTVQSGTATGVASQITSSPTGTIAATNVQAAIQELNDEKQGYDVELETLAQILVTDDSISVANGTIWQGKILPSCSNATSSKLLYDTATNAFSCGADQGGTGSGAPTDATYITQTANATLTNEQVLASLATGVVKVTTGTGVLSVVTGTSTNCITVAGNESACSGSTPTYVLVTQSTSATISGTATHVLCNAAGGSINLTVPVTANRQVNIKKIDNSLNSCTVVPASGNIDGAPNQSWTTQYTAITTVGDGTNLHIF